MADYSIRVVDELNLDKIPHIVTIGGLDKIGDQLRVWRGFPSIRRPSPHGDGGIHFDGYGSDSCLFGAHGKEEVKKNLKILLSSRKYHEFSDIYGNKIFFPFD